MTTPADVEAVRAAATAAALELADACKGWPIDRDRLDAARAAFDRADKARADAEAQAWPRHLRPRLTASVGRDLSDTRPGLASRLLSAVNDAINLLPASAAAPLVAALAVGDLPALRAAADALRGAVMADSPMTPVAEAMRARIVGELAAAAAG